MTTSKLYNWLLQVCWLALILLGGLYVCIPANLPDTHAEIVDSGPRLPRFFTLRAAAIPDLASELNYYAGMGYRVVTAAGGIGGPVVVLELREGD